MSEFAAAVIYADLDVLLDTRLATLYRLDPTKIHQVITGGYYSRLFDEFEGYDTDEFKKLYAERDLHTLKHAMVTEITDAINFFAQNTLKALLNTPFRRQPKLVVNVHPYKNINKETESLIITALSVLTKKQLDIEVIDMSYEELTPVYVKSNYIFVIMYEYWRWLEIHSVNRNLAETQLPSVTMIGPALIKSSEAAAMLKGIDPFRAIEQYSSLYIKLVLYPISKFSVDINRAKTMA